MATPFFGRFSEEVGLTTENVLNFVPGLIREIKVGLVLEIRELLKSTDMECAKHVIVLVGGDEAMYNLEQMRLSIFRTFEKVKKLKKNKQKGLDEFMSSTFQLPECNPTHESSKHENKKLKRTLNSTRDAYLSTLSDYGILKECLSEIISDYENTISQFEKSESATKQTLDSRMTEIEHLNLEQTCQIDQLITQLTKMKDKQNLASSERRNLSKKVKRRDDQIQNLTQKLDLSFDETCLDQTKEESESLSLHSNVHDVYNLRRQIKRLRDDQSKIREDSDNENSKLNEEIKSLKSQIKELVRTKENLEKDLIPMLDDKKYSNNVRACCMSLVTEGNVSMNKVPTVISTVLENLVGLKADRLPSKALLSSYIIPEGKVVACKQIADKMLENFDPTENSGNVLHQDATTKHSDHYEGMQVTLKGGANLSIGLSKVGAGSSETYIDVFHNIINDLAMAYSGQITNTEDDRAKLIASIKSLLSDQCATNPSFNKAIESIRSSLLPGIIPNFHELCESEKLRITQMGKFACRLHLLANFGTAADKALKMFEDAVSFGKNPYAFSSDESGTFRLARTSAKAFTKRGCDKSGIALYWDSYLKSKGKKNLLLTFHGHRINIAFYDCAAVYYHKNDIFDLLDNLDKPNNLLKAILFDIKEKAYLAGARAMGIFYELVTAPFWKILEDDGSILDLNEDILQMKLTLGQWSEDGLEPLSGSPMFAASRVQHHSENFHEPLFAPSNDDELDSYTQIALELLSSQLLIILERQAASQLPEGHYFDPSDDLREVASNVSKTNAISERDMAILDNLLRAKPAASALSLETILLWTRNKPSSWLKTLPEHEREGLMRDARKMGPQFKKMFNERQKLVRDQISERLLEKKSKRVKDDQIKISNKMALSNEVLKYGGVWDESTIGGKLDKIREESSNPEKSEREAVLLQIRFHRTVLLSKGPKELFQESVKKRKYTTEELISNLRQILALNAGQSSSSSETCSDTLRYRTNTEIHHRLITQKEALCLKLSMQREQQKVNQIKNLLPTFLDNPQLLVNKRISHKCLEAGKSVQWYSGWVIAIKTLKEDRIKSEYLIRYDDSPDDEWFFPLLLDIKKGDLIVYM